MATSRAKQDAANGPYPHDLTREQLVELYYYMRLTRSLEERLVALYRQSKVIGGLFRSLGQEADAVGSAYALDRERGDILSPLIRNLGSMLVQGAEPVEVLRQYMAKASSPTRGRELNIHFGTPERGFIGQISHLGDLVPVMAGIALTFKMRGEDRVALAYVGDGATSTGAFHEGMNFAAALRLPLVVIAEYNGYAFSTPPERQFAVKDIADRGQVYGVASEAVDGNHVLDVFGATRRAVGRARDGEGPTLLELKTYRRKGHAEHDDQHYVPADELEWWAANNDPIDRYVALLTAEHGWIAAEELAEVDARVVDELEEALASCQEEPMPDGESALTGVLADPADAPVAWYRGSHG